MSDTSPYLREERIVMAVWVHERHRQRESLDDLRTRFRIRFNKEPPRKNRTLRTWERKLFNTGTIRDRPRSGRPVTRRERCQAVDQSINESPLKSTRKRAAEIGVPRTTMCRFIKEDLKMRCFRPMFVNELSDSDLDNRARCCKALLDTFVSISSRGKVFFSDECAIYRSSRSRNVYFWAKENPHFVEQVAHHPPHVMVWAAVSSRYCIGPYFFDGPVNQEAYLSMLQDFFYPCAGCSWHSSDNMAAARWCASSLCTDCSAVPGPGVSAALDRKRECCLTGSSRLAPQEPRSQYLR